MDPGLYTGDFSRAFSSLLEKTGVSCYKIAEFSHLDQAYLSRLRNGTKRNPSPETIMKISLAIAHNAEKVSIYDLDLLFKSVGRSLHMD